MSAEYLLSGQRSELERLRLQSLVWEPAADALFAAIPVKPGARCIDVGCGAIGALRPLSRAAGPAGSVLGVDVDPTLLQNAQAFVTEQRLGNVTVRRGDLFDRADLPDQAFDLVHLRFMLAPIGREEELLANAVRLCRPGGVVVLQEPDAACWSTIPPAESFHRLRDIVLTAFRGGGGDFNAGRRTYALARRAGLLSVQIRAAVEALPPRHPYLRVILQFATSLRGRILDSSIATEEELDQVTADVESTLNDDSTAGLTFVVTQVWGVKPNA